MECREVHLRIPAYADDDLRPGERRLVERHLAGCPDCQEEAQEVSRLLDTCHEFLVCPGAGYSFEALRVRMADITPLAEIVAFLPKLKIEGTVPRLAVTALMILLVGLPALSARTARPPEDMVDFKQYRDDVELACEGRFDELWQEDPAGRHSSHRA